MKREYIILGLIIAALSAYLVIHKTDRNNYILPSLPQINVADVTDIAIEKGGRTTLLSKKEGAWVVTDKNYPASEESVKQMLDIIKDLKLSALVSESGNLTPYELDSKNRISVTVKSKAQTVGKFEIGKTAPSFRHTFVRIDGNNSVYHAVKSFRREFDKSVDELRDKKVLSFDRKKISAITVKKGDMVKEVAIKDGKPVAGTDQKGSEIKGDKAVADGVGGRAVEKGADDKPAAEESGVSGDQSVAVEALLTMLSDFQCHSFTSKESKDEFKALEEVASVTLKGDKEYSLVVYKKDADASYPALSSENIYPFLIQTYQGDDLISKLDNLLGISKKDEKAQAAAPAEVAMPPAEKLPAEAPGSAAAPISQ